MYINQKELLELRDLYNKLIKKLDSKKAIDIDGHLIIDRYKNLPKFYLVRYDKSTGRKKKKYIAKKNIRLIKMLAQKSYDKRARNFLEKRLKILNLACKVGLDRNIDDIYASLSKERKKLVSPIVPSRDKYVAKWLAKPHIAPPLNYPNNGIISKNGESVRSKSEKILADMFYDQKIPYKYECPLSIKGTIVYPDFTFLSPYDNSEIYWEHHGMMGDPAYAEKTVKKILLYEKNKIHQGQNLILTFEGKNATFDFDVAQHFIDRLLKKR